MALVDVQFADLVSKILTQGYSDEGMWTRTKWADGTPAHTLKLHNVVMYHYPLYEFPLLTLRKTDLKKAVEEILWIFQKQSNNVNDFSLHIWDQWADETGSIGKSYGYQAGVKYEYPDGKMNQVDRLLKDLKEAPMSRRHIITLYNPHDLKDMHLAPCCCYLVFNVRPPQHPGEKMILDMMLCQRSWDLLTAGGWDIAAHAALQMMIAQSVDMIPGQFCHMVNNAHIYDRHIELIKSVITGPTYEAPRVTLDPDIHDFYAFTPESWTVEGYQSNTLSGKIEVAI
ncbi:MAG: thymidylate synthase [Ruminococcus flavefaciens]|nr:thymidylate synthase [Ruminococcus flavefaciens]